MALITHSALESEVFGCSVARAIVSTGQLNQFNEELRARPFELIRLRFDGPQEQFITSIPNYLHHRAGCIVLYSFNMQGWAHAPYFNHDTHFVTYDGTQRADVERIIRAGCAEDPIGYYHTPELNARFGKQMEVELMVRYYTEFFVDEVRQLWLVHSRGAFQGFVANEIEDGVMDTPLAVVVPEARGWNLLHEIMVERNNYGLRHGLHTIKNGARIDNPVTNHVFHKFGMERTGVHQVFHIMRSGVF
jgi:hypothetical protein